MRPPLTHKKVRFGGGRLFLGETYRLKAIRPVDFTDEQNGFPLCFITGIEAEKTKYEQSLEAAGMSHKFTKEDTEAQARALKFVLKHGVIDCNGKPFEVESFMRQKATRANTRKMLVLFWEVLNMSIKVFIKEKKVTTTSALNTYILAKRYSKTPIEVLLPEGGYSELDAHMFNLYVTNIGLKEEERQAKKAMKK